MESPAVSVVIPVWNSGKYFRECLDSVVGQTLRNIEILIVDDASTDGSGAVADEFAARDNRITVLHQKESIGSGPARNAAMAIARGEYIAFMDSDDLYPSVDVLKVLYDKAIENKANICGGSLYKIDREGNIINNKIPNQFFINEEWCNYKEYQYDGGFYRFLYLRNFLNKNKIIFKNYIRFQDPVFFVHVMILSEKFYTIPMWVYAYRVNHKKNIWTLCKVRHHLYGVRDVFYMSLENKLDYLHFCMVKNIFESLKYKMNFVCRMYNLFFIIELLKDVNWLYINKYSCITKITLPRMVVRIIFG